MNNSWKLRICSLSVTVVLTPALVRAQVFSLDDNPSAPLTTAVPMPGATPFLPFGFGAEDPFGTVVGPPGLAPSPSLLPPFAGVWIDGTWLETGAAFPGEPELHMPPPFDGPSGLMHTYIDALSNNPIPSDPATINLLFSIDRTSAGVPGSDSFIEAGFSQQPADIYVTSSVFANPESFAGTLAPGMGFVAGPLNPPSPGTNRLLFNQSDFDLTAGLPPGPLPPFVAAPPIVPGSHDNIDAFDLNSIDVDGDLVADVPYYFSINPDDAVNKQYATGLLFDSADIRFAPVGAGGASFLFAPAMAMGLAPMPIVPMPLPPIVTANDIDALVVWDIGGDGFAVAGVDFALFSLAPGSADLAAFGNSPADVFFTDFSGSYAIFASADDLGLLPADNLDALEIILSGDATLDNAVDLADLAMLLANYDTTPAIDGWSVGDFDGNGIVGLSDFVMLTGAFTFVTGSGTGSALPAFEVAPEPAAVALALLAIIGGFLASNGRAKRTLRARAILSCVAALIVMTSAISTSRGAALFVSSRSLGGGLIQHRLTVTANDGDVLGFEIRLADALGRINDTAAPGNTVFADRLSPPFGLNPPEDTHVLYDSTEGLSFFTVDTATDFSITTAVPPATPLVANGSSRDLFQLVTVGPIELVPSRLRVNVGGPNGDQIFDGTVMARLGDYNFDGVVDAADYIVWRMTLGASGAGLAADGDGSGDVGAPDFAIWRANFGEVTPGSGAGVGATGGVPSGSSAAVPEPASFWLLLCAAATASALSRRRVVAKNWLL